MRGLADASMSGFDSNEFFSGNSMFDCPLQTHTSPTKTLLSVMEFFPETVSVSGPPAFNLWRCTIHLPSLATVLAFCPRKLTVTSSPSSAQPQTVTFIPCCNTILSEKRFGRRTSARANGALAKTSERRPETTVRKRLLRIMFEDFQEKAMLPMLIWLNC